jgi:ATP-dependent RNA helicase RhlE
MTFEELGLMPRLVEQLKEQGIVDPTPIQIQAIPHALAGRDVMGLAQTGTGKTAAFGLPIMNHLLKVGKKPAPKTVRGLILAPTRELAGQIKDNLTAYSQGTHIKVGLVVGGMSISAQVNRLARGTDLLIATPGRLIDLIERKAVDLSETQFLILDEADQMLDLGFIHALRQIAPLLAAERQTMLFSATMPKHMNELAATYLKNPERVAVSRPGEVADKITQEVHFVAGAAKTDFLIEKLAEHRSDAAIVFARTKHGSERLMKTLSKAGYTTDSVHGNKSQGQRQRAIDALRGGTIKVLVATDVAARGLDIPDVRFVYNYDLPNVPENYVHRIGRTARAGRDGRAIAFVAPDEMGELKDVEKVLKMEIPIASGRRWDLVPGVDTRKPKRKQPSGRGGGGGGAGGGRRNNDNWGKEQPRGGRGGAPKAHTARAEAKPAREGRWDPTNDGPALEAPKPKGRKSKGQASDQAQGPVGNGGRPQRGPSGAKFVGKPKGRGGKPKGKPNMGGNAKPRRPQA